MKSQLSEIDCGGPFRLPAAEGLRLVGRFAQSVPASQQQLSGMVAVMSREAVRGVDLLAGPRGSVDEPETWRSPLIQRPPAFVGPDRRDTLRRLMAAGESSGGVNSVDDVVVLASRSPQRTAILDQLGIAHDVLPVDVGETADGPADEVVRTNALAKAQAAARLRPHSTILGVDTIVVIDGEIIGKPPSEDAAKATLKRLQGRAHEVVSGLALLTPGNTHVVHEATEVTFRPLDDALIDAYVATGEWRERAGGYAIQGQGAGLVLRIMGDYLNVVGLPVALLLDLDLSLILREK